jgi:hypothetical protein
LLFFLQSETARNRGEFTKSRERNRRTADSALQAHEKEGAAEYQAHAAVREASDSKLVGDQAGKCLM